MNYLFVAFQENEKGLGTGHVSRVERVINSFISDKRSSIDKITFLTNNPNKVNSYNKVIAKNFAEASGIIKKIISQKKVDIVVFDCLDFYNDIYELCKEKGVFSIGLDTSSPASFHLDLLINPVIKNKFSNLNGSMYSIHYEENNNFSYELNDDNNKIFICFGGIDYKNHLYKITPFLNNISRMFEINIILSKNHRRIDLDLPKNSNVFFYPENFYELLKSSKLAIISGGVLFQEVQYLGIPSYVIPQYEHQLEIVKEKNKSTSIVGFASLKPNYKKIIEEINSSLDNFNNLKIISTISRSYDDGFGLRRFNSFLRIYDYLEWDSNFFKKEIYRLNVKCFTPSVSNKVKFLIDNKKIDLIYFLCPSSNNSSINLALAQGFKIIVNRLTFCVTPTSFRPSYLKDKSIIKRSKNEDIQNLVVLASKINWVTRYAKDNNFDKDQIKKFYSEWVKKSVQGKLDDIVFQLEIDKKIYGFISIKKNGNNFGSIGLVAVVEEYNGKGVASTLVSFAVDYLFKNMGCASVEVVTQKDNISACRVYTKIGFQIENDSVWMHNWI